MIYVRDNISWSVRYIHFCCVINHFHLIMQSVCFHYMDYGKKKQHKSNTPTTSTSNRVLFLTFCSIMSYCPRNVYFQITITRKFKALNKINKQTNVDDSVDSSFEAPIRLYIWAEWYTIPLWSTDAAGRVPHRSPIWLPASWCCAWAFFFFLFFSRICINSAWFAPNWADSTGIGLYRPNQVLSTDNQNGQSGSKSTLNHAGIAEIGFEWDPSILNLSFLNFILNICYFFCVFCFFFLCFVNQGIVMDFLRIF